MTALGAEGFRNRVRLWRHLGSTEEGAAGDFQVQNAAALAGRHSHLQHAGSFLWSTLQVGLRGHHINRHVHACAHACISRCAKQSPLATAGCRSNCEGLADDTAG